MRTVRLSAVIAVVAAVLTIVTACGSSPEAKPSSAPTTPVPTSGPEPLGYCDLLMLFDTSLTGFEMELITTDDNADAKTRGELAASAERISEQALELSEDAPDEIAAALITVGHAVLDVGERLMDGDPVLDALNEMTDDKDLKARDTIDGHLEKGACKAA